MSAGTLYFSELGTTENGSWTDGANAIGQYDVATAYTSALTGDGAMGGGLDNHAAGTPSSLGLV